MLNGQAVTKIHADLTAGDGLNLTLANPLKENEKVAFIGTQKNGAFDIEGELARQWLKQPNPNGKPNSDVVRPWSNGMDITRRPSDTWIIDFGVAMSEQDAALYELPFQYVTEKIKPVRLVNREEVIRKIWWLHKRTSPALRTALAPLKRFIATSMVSKHRFFVWLPVCQIPENLCVAIARSDDTTFGILHSRFHELWSLRMGTSLEDRPRYTPSTTFETFPFPEGLTPLDTSFSVRPELVEGCTDAQPIHASTSSARTEESNAIALAAQTLNTLRENWLNPPEWVDWQRTEEEEKAGFPLRPVAKAGFEAELKKRTLTNLYNARPAWLDNAHKTLDAAVARAYGWQDYTPEMPDEEILRRLLALNLKKC
jgi:hypothetical protein